MAQIHALTYTYAKVPTEKRMNKKNYLNIKNNLNRIFWFCVFFFSFFRFSICFLIHFMMVHRLHSTHYTLTLC